MVNELPDHPVIRNMERYGTDGRWIDLPKVREADEWKEDDDGE